MLGWASSKQWMRAAVVQNKAIAGVFGAALLALLGVMLWMLVEGALQARRCDKLCRCPTTPSALAAADGKSPAPEDDPSQCSTNHPAVFAITCSSLLLIVIVYVLAAFGVALREHYAATKE